MHHSGAQDRLSSLQCIYKSEDIQATAACRRRWTGTEVYFDGPNLGISVVSRMLMVQIDLETDCWRV